MDVSIRRNLKPLKWNLAWNVLHLSDMVHQVAVGFENFEDFFFNGKNAEKSFKCWSFFDFRKRWGAYTCQSGSYQKDHYEIPVHHQVAFGFGNFEDNYLMEEMLKEALNRDLCLTLGRDEGPTSVSREAARKVNYICLWNSPSTPLFLFLKGLIMSGNPEISL